MGRLSANVGELHGGLPMLKVGTGPPLLLLSGLTSSHSVPTGLDRRVQLRTTRFLAERFTVHLVSRHPGLTPGTTMADLADDLAAAIRHDFDGPVAVEGVSTGGSIAMQLAVGNPDLVTRIVLAASACRVSASGRAALERFVELAIAGRARAAWVALAPAVGTGPVSRRLVKPMLWANGGAGEASGLAEAVVTATALLAFDATALLGSVGVPTLVVGGARDGFFGPELFRQTAAGIPGAELVIAPRRGHADVILAPDVRRRTLTFLT